MRLRLEAAISINRQPSGFRTFYVQVTLFRRFWIQRWNVTGRRNWTWGTS